MCYHPLNEILLCFFLISKIITPFLSHSYIVLINTSTVFHIVDFISFNKFISFFPHFFFCNNYICANILMVSLNIHLFYLFFCIISFITIVFSFLPFSTIFCLNNLYFHIFVHFHYYFVNFFIAFFLICPSFLVYQYNTFSYFLIFSLCIFLLTYFSRSYSEHLFF